MTKTGPKPGKRRRIHDCACGDHSWVALTKGYVTLFDTEDAPSVSVCSWSSHIQRKAGNREHVYGKGTIDVNTVLLHRHILGYPEGVVDHWSGDTLDNRRTNLRVTDHGGNSRNRLGSPNSAAGYKGVWLNQSGRRWNAEITANGVDYFLGGFATPEEAARAYDAKARELHGEFARLNFPDV